MAELYRALRDERVLSVYIAAEAHDPTERASWRGRLEPGLDRAAAALEDEDRPEFELARTAVLERLAPYQGFLPGRGWVGFATAAGVRLLTSVAVRMPNTVRWQRGPLLGPWLAAAKQERLVIIGIADSRRARLFRYRLGEIAEVEDYRADSFIDDLTDRNMSKRAATHSGVRGETGTDAAHRIADQEAERHLAGVAEWITTEVGDGLVVLGGPVESVSMLQGRLASRVGDRLTVVSSLYTLMPAPAVKAAAEPAISTLTGQLQLHRVHDLLHDAGGRVVRGLAGVAGLMDGQVEALLLSSGVLGEHEAESEHVIGRVLDTGGEIDVVAGEAASVLDAEAGGVAARLRFPRPQGLTAAARPAGRPLPEPGATTVSGDAVRR
jgi:hypothetical protein